MITGTFSFQNYDGKDTFIVTRTSNEGTVEMLWKMIEKHNIKTVITLFDENDRAEKVILFYKIFSVIFT